MNSFKNICPNKMRKERVKREHDLLILNCVSENEFESRMAIWDSLANSTAPLAEIKHFILNAFNIFEHKVQKAHSELTVSQVEFTTFATEEIQYIKNNVVNRSNQIIWYAVIVLTISGILAICL